MENKNLVITGIAIGVLICSIASLSFGLLGAKNRPTLSSVSQSGEYIATTTANMGNNKSQLILSNTTGTLGSVVIASTTSLGTIELRDATSTTDLSYSTIVTFPAGTAAGTYTFDDILTRGLVAVISSGFNGGYVITYRQR